MENDLRVVLFRGTYDAVADGSSLTLDRLTSHLKSSGARVLGVAPTDGRRSDPADDELIRVPSLPIPCRGEYRVGMSLPRAARARIASFRPNLFHVTAPDPVGFLGLKLASAWNVPVVGSYHTHLADYFHYYGLALLQRPAMACLCRFYGRCRHVYVPSRPVASRLREQGLDAEVRLWRRGVDHRLFRPDRRSSNWRRRLGIEDDEPVVLFVSRLVREKGLAVLAQALGRLRDRGVRHRAVVVGDGPHGTTLRRRLSEAIFTGFLHGEELATAYASAEVFLFPSRTETFGSVTLEAMASGLPVVAADAGGSRALVEHGVTGFLDRPDDPEPLAAHTARLLEDVGLRRRLGKAARDRSVDFDWERENARLLDHYREVLRPATWGRSARRVEASGGNAIEPPAIPPAPGPDRIRA